MRNNNYLGLINFKVKTSSSETFFFNEHGVVCSNVKEIVRNAGNLKIKETLLIAKLHP